MPQIRSSYEEIRIPFNQMTFSPDVPSTVLQPNEYNDGLNVETDVRGIRSVAGDKPILPPFPTGEAAPTFITGGFRQDNEFWFVIATQRNGTTPGKYFASNGGAWTDITPLTGDFSQYTQSTNITEAWNGTVLFLNDETNPPMFWPDQPNAVLQMYSNQVPLEIDDITFTSLTERTATFSVSQPTAPYTPGEYIFINDVNPRYFNGGPFLVTACTTDDVTYEDSTNDTYLNGGVVSPQYTWNYNGDWLNLNAKWMRQYNTPNVGSILVAGNLTTNVINIEATVANGSATMTSAGALDVMDGGLISGPGIPTGTTITAVTAGVDLTLSNPATLDDTAFYTIQLDNGTNSYEIYPVTIRWSQQFGLNEAPQSWIPTVNNIANELEVPLRGPALDAFPCNGQFFVCSYWDTIVLSPINFSTTSAPILGVRQFNQGRGLLNPNCWANTDKLVYGVDARDIWVFDGNDFRGLGNQRVKNYFYDQLDPEYYSRVFMEVNTQKNQIELYYPDSDAIDGVANKMISYRYDIDCWNAPRDVNLATFACESPIWQYINSNWIAEYGSRTIVYAQALEEGSIAMKDQGYTNLDGSGISSYWRRDNIKLIKDYSGKTMVHRVLPEAVNLGAEPFTDDDERPVDPATSTNKGNLTVTIEAANSVASQPANISIVTNTIDTEYPWMQINQNAYRVHSLELSNTSNNSVWMCSALTWQYTQVEDDR